MTSADGEPGADGPRPLRAMGLLRARAGGRRGETLRRVLLALTGGLVLLAAVTVVLADDPRWLRLGVVAALWATLAAVYALVRRAEQPDAEALRRTYELELADEIAARREHELTVEQTVRRELEAERGAEIEALRDELEQMRVALEQRWGEQSADTGGLVTRLRVVGGSAVSPSGSEPVVSPVRPTGPHAGPVGRGYGGPSRPGIDRAPLRPAGPPASTGPATPAGPTAAPGARSGGPGGGPSTGRTVAELLAAHAASGAPPHRRRR